MPAPRKRSRKGISVPRARSLKKSLDAPVEVSFLVGTKTMAMAEILGLRPGSLVENLDMGTIQMVINGLAFAEGELVTSDRGRSHIIINKILG